MPVQSWDILRECGILAVGSVLFLVGCWETLRPPLVDACRRSRSGTGSRGSACLAFLAGPAGYAICLVVNAVWFGYSSWSAGTAENPPPLNLIDDSLVAVQVAVLLVACGLVAKDGAFVTVQGRMDEAGGASASWRWIGSFALVGIVANGLALLDSHRQVLNDPESRHMPLGWYWTNGVTIACFAVGILLVLVARASSLERVFDRCVGFGSFLALILVGAVAWLTNGF